MELLRLFRKTENGAIKGEIKLDNGTHVVVGLLDKFVSDGSEYLVTSLELDINSEFERVIFNNIETEKPESVIRWIK